jgi:hypothetical protein
MGTKMKKVPGTIAFLLFVGGSGYVQYALSAPLILATDYQDSISLSCAGAQECELLFTAIPAAKRLVVLSVGCSLTSNTSSVGGGSAIPTSMYMSSKSSTGVQSQYLAYLSPDWSNQINAIRTIQAQEEVYLVIPPGSKPQIKASFSNPISPFSLNCTISGELK